MDEPRDYHTDRSKSERERQIPYDITYMWNLKYDTNEYIYETERLTDIGNGLVVIKWVWGMVAGEFGIGRCKLVYIGWINNKVLLCSTGNYIQYPVINQNMEEYEKEYIYMYD